MRIVCKPHAASSTVVGVRLKAQAPHPIWRQRPHDSAGACGSSQAAERQLLVFTALHGLRSDRTMAARWFKFITIGILCGYGQPRGPGAAWPARTELCGHVGKISQPMQHSQHSKPECQTIVMLCARGHGGLEGEVSAGALHATGLSTGAARAAPKFRYACVGAAAASLCKCAEGC